MKNVFISLCIFLVIVHCFTACTDNSISKSESFPDGGEKISESFSNEITTEAVESPTVKENNDAENNANTEESYGISTNASESAISQEITETTLPRNNLYGDSTETNVGYFANNMYEFTVTPVAADVNDYVDKEIIAMIAFIVNRDKINEEYWEYYSALIFYTDGTCAAGIFKSDARPNGFLGNFNTVYDAEEIICFDVIGSIDSDISELLNECLNLIDTNSEWKYYHGYKPYDPDEPETYPAVVEAYDYDLVHFLDNEVNTFSSYEVKPMKKFEDAVLYAELDDNYAKESRDFLIKSGIVDYWLENYAWKIGE